MVRRRPPAAAVALLVVALLVAALATAGCGGEDETSPQAPQTTVAGSASGASGVAGAVPDCVENFNSRADDNLPRIARLAHESGGLVMVGTFAGEPFDAETYDVDAREGDGTETTVAPGNCIVTEVSDEVGTLYVFVVGDDGDWHNLLVTDPDVELADDPASQLGNVQTVELEDVKAPAVPKLIP
jgi:hypothetical protein